MAFAYANTLPNTKTFFPPSDRAFHSTAPWATVTGFTLPTGTGCPASSSYSSCAQSTWNPFSGPEGGCSSAMLKTTACDAICKQAPNSSACKSCRT